MEEKVIAFENATRMLVWGIVNEVPYDVISETDEVREAVALGYQLEVVHDAWM